MAECRPENLGGARIKVGDEWFDSLANGN